MESGKWEVESKSEKGRSLVTPTAKNPHSVLLSSEFCVLKADSDTDTDPDTYVPYIRASTDEIGASIHWVSAERVLVHVQR